MNTLTLSVSRMGDPLYQDVCAFEAQFLKAYYDAYPILTNDFVVSIREGEDIIAAATYASGLTNKVLIPEVAMPDAFLQPDGTPFPRSDIAEYAGRTFDEAVVTEKSLRLRYADVLSLTVYRIARILKIQLLAGISGAGEKALYRRIGLATRTYLIDRIGQDRVEQYFNDRWDIYFSKPRHVTNILIAEQQSDGIERWKNAVSRVHGLIVDTTTEDFVTQTI